MAVDEVDPLVGEQLGGEGRRGGGLHGQALQPRERADRLDDAWSPESVVERLLKNGLRRRTDDAITSVEELVRCRERGFSIDDVENEPGVRGVGAPVMDYRGWPVAALSVAGPEHRVGRDGLADLGRATAEAARELSTRLGYSPRVASAGS
ncbi:hypothetical protein GCM10023191_082590 [Actinoallomurus oryzae]|uniref:IclR-ED domain-containing protein n=1 Tax=Actinoallomurus oryzae TaxID=502180 RepID=A0ABP8QZS2_9ACTN